LLRVTSPLPRIYALSGSLERITTLAQRLSDGLRRSMSEITKLIAKSTAYFTVIVTAGEFLCLDFFILG